MRYMKDRFYVRYVDSLRLFIPSFLEILYSLNAKYGSENFPLSDSHLGRYAVQNSRREIESVFITFDLNVSAVEYYFRALVNAFLYPRFYALLMLRAVYRTEIGRLVISGSHFLYSSQAPTSFSISLSAMLSCATTTGNAIHLSPAQP